MKLSIVVVHYNVKLFLENCLASVEAACKNIESEIFVIDNASTDGSEVYFQHRFGNVKFTWNKINIGFAKANNSVLKEVSGEYILFLNPDTLVPEDCFEKCISFFTTHKDCGALGVRMLNGKGVFLKESKRGFPTPLASLYKLIGIHNIFPRSTIFSKYYVGSISEHETHSVDVLSGAFMMMSKEALAKVKGFDEDYFMYGEDIDLSNRIIKAGYKNYYFPLTTITHFKGESTKKNSANYTRQFYNSMKIFVKKYYAHQKFISAMLVCAIGFAQFFSNLKRIIFNGLNFSKSKTGK